MYTFNWIEYAVFSFMLGLSALIGVYYGCYKGNQNTVSEYMQGGKKMGVFPITMSLIASHVSGITIIGVPAEVYTYGTQYLGVLWCNILVAVLVVLFYLPVFFKLQLKSPYEYLEMRFNRTVRTITSLIFAVLLILFLPTVIYIPAIAFNQVTGMPVHALTVTMSAICIFYTTLGGLKAVVWTDSLQSIFIAGSIGLVITAGIISVGGLEKIYEVNRQGDRLEMFNMDPSPFTRNTFWTVTFGQAIPWLAHIAVHPGAIQRFTAVPTYKDAIKVTCWFAFGVALVKTAAVFMGLLIYTKYNECDLLTTKVIKKSGQLLPYFVMDIAGHIPGLNGIFLSGVVSAALSTMSAGLNTVAWTIYEDFIMICCAKKHDDARASFIMKIIVIVVGLICTALILLIEKMGGIIQMVVSLGGITNGAIVFVFTFGMLFPWGTTKGALAGIIACLLSSGWIVFGSQRAIVEGRMRFPGRIISVNGCSNSTLARLNETFTYNYKGIPPAVVTDGTVARIYQISYLYYAATGVIVGFTVGVIVTFLTGLEDLEKLDSNLIVPQMQRFLPKKSSKSRNKVNHEIELIPLKDDTTGLNLQEEDKQNMHRPT